jgi:hypothetical protein
MVDCGDWSACFWVVEFFLLFEDIFGEFPKWECGL